MQRRVCLSLAGAWLVPMPAQAQANNRMRRIGILGNVTPANDALHRLFVAAMSELGWREGKEVTYEFRGAEQRYERLPELARELVAL